MKIKKLNIKNFKGIVSANIHLGDLTVITGKNSSGKSSLIQSIKYVTQWLNRVETTRGLNQFSAPGLNVYHPDFITENLRYDAIKNSKSSNGVSLGIEYENQLFSKYNPIVGQHNEIQIDLEKASQKGEIARLKNIKINNEWLDKTEEYEQFYSIYSDETDADLTELRRKYINGYSLGIFDPKNTRKFAKDYFPDTLKHNKDESLHTLWSYDPSFEDLIDPIKKLIQTQEPDSRREEALIINKKGERLMFQKNPFEILESTGYEHYFVNFFFDYVHKSHNKDLDKEGDLTKNLTSDDTYFPTSEFYEDLFQLISNIYKKNYDKQLLDYLNQNIPINMSKKELEKLERSFMGPYSKYPHEEGLNLQFLEVLREQLPKDVFNEFKKLTKLINNTTKYKDKADKHAEKRAGHAQCVLMFIYYLNNLMNSKNAIDLNKHIDELVSDNDMLTQEGPSKSVLERPVQSIIDLQNMLAKAAKAIGYTAWDKAYLKWIIKGEQMFCICPADGNYDPYPPEGLQKKEIESNEIILACEFNPIAEHVYALTTPQEQKELTPNDYTLQPHVNLRGLDTENFMLISLKNFLSEKLIEKTIYDTSGTADKRLLFFGSLLKDDSKKVDYGKQAKSFLTTKKIADSLRERINDINQREKKYKNNLENLKHELKVIRKDFGKYKEILSRDLSSEDRNKHNKDLQFVEKARFQTEDKIISYEEDLKIIEKDKSKLLLQLEEINTERDEQSKKVDSKKLEKLVTFVDTLFTPLVGYKSKSISVAELSKDIKFLNNGRNPSLQEQAGAFSENLTVGKFGGLLPNLMFTSSDELVDPFLYPSSSSKPPFDRSYEELDWHFLGYSDFEDAFNSWVSYLEMEISQVESVMDGPTPMLKVQGKDSESRNIFEVGSGVSQVLPVIAICLLAKPEEVVCIEEPESNLHPSAQAYLADFLLAMAASGRQIIIETHSPNIIDRIRLRKAHKKSWRKLKDSKWVASSLSMDKYSKVDDEVRHFLEPKINIIFAEQNSEGNSEYRQAILDKNGDIIFDGSSEELWPKGFFDNTQEELSNILKARIYSEEE